jgi:hypothetical protein
MQGVEKEKSGQGEATTHALNRDEIKVEDLRGELKGGAQLISYSSTDPI